MLIQNDGIELTVHEIGSEQSQLIAYSNRCLKRKILNKNFIAIRSRLRFKNRNMSY